MGEIAEMMLTGAMCPCGVFLGGDGAGFPRYCSAECEADYGPGEPELRPSDRPRTLKREKVPCPRCGKKVSPVGLAQHLRDRHGETAPRGGREER